MAFLSSPNSPLLRGTIPVLTTLLSSALVASASLAADGIFEINQTCAEQGGCFPGDTAGFPVTISAPGSYRSTSNLEVPTLNTTAIQVVADDVQIDLAGFVIRGREDCRPDCGAPGSGSGIDASGRENVAVRNGTVIGMGNSAVRSGELASVSGIKAIGNGGSAIVVGDLSEIRTSHVNGAGGVGIAVGNESSVSGCLVRGASDEGIRGGSSVLVSGSRIIGNGDTGIRLTGTNGAAHENIISGNGGAGAWFMDGLIAENVIAGNQSFAVYFLGGMGGVVRGNQVKQNASGVDVATSQGTVVTENAIVANGGPGVQAATPDGIGGNVLHANSATISGGNLLGQNACDGNTTCP